MQPPYILAIDQGTTSSRCIVFDAAAKPIAVAQREFAQHYPASGWVEHDLEDIWQDVVTVLREAVGKAGIDVADVAAIGITNQRETVAVWDRATGKPIHRAIVWQDRRTADTCARLKAGSIGPVRPFGRGGPVTGEGMAIEGRDVYVLPEDGPSRVFHFRLNA